MSKVDVIEAEENSELVRLAYTYGYSQGKADAVNGVYIDPRNLADSFVEKLNSKSEFVDVFDDIER